MERFEGFHLPELTGPATHTIDLDPGAEGGRASGALLWPEVAPDSARAVWTRLAGAEHGLRERTNQELVDVLGRFGERLLDQEDPLRAQARLWLPRESGLSVPMTDLLLDRMARDWTRPALERLLREEFPDPRVLEGFRPGPRPDLVRALGPAPAFHVSAGNVPGVGATSVIRSLLVRSPVLLKPGRGDVVLPVLLARSLAEDDPDLARAVAVTYWPGGTPSAVEEVGLRQARLVVVYGGMETVARLRAHLPDTTPLVAYRHRISLGVVGRSRLKSRGEAEAVAAQVAEAVSAYDQAGCVSPHVVWVEDGGAVGPRQWAELLAEAMEVASTRLPAGPKSPVLAARIQQHRALSAMKEAGGEGPGLWMSPDLAWTVIYQADGEPGAGCGGRLVRVQTLERLDDLPSLVGDQGPWLQSVAVAADEDRTAELAEALGRIGVSRITTFSRQPWPSAWWTHDGEGPLRALVRWTTLERPPSS
jgi:hypothetical protein